MKSSGGSSGHVGVYVGQDWWMHLSTYDDHTPILDISSGSMTVAVSIADRKVSQAALEFARELAAKAARYAAEVERLHVAQRSESEACEACQARGAGEGEAS